ncbi:MAG: glycosyltransferase family 4 protein [Gemmatimonadales bacterium]
MRRSVLLLGNHPPPFGGVPTHVEYLATHLATNGWEVHVVSMTGPRGTPVFRNGYTVHRPSRSERQAALVQSLLGTPRRLLRRLTETRQMAAEAPWLYLGSLAFAEWARALVQRHNLGLVSAYHLFSAGLVGSWLSRDLGIPLATTIFGEIYENPQRYRRRLGEVRQIVEQSDILLSCSRHCAASLRLLGLEAAVETIYYGVDTARFSPERDSGSIRARLGIPADRPIVLYLGRMNRLMGMGVILQAIPAVLDRYPDAVFLLAGGRDELTAKAMEAQARWPANVRVTPDVSSEDLPLCYAAASVVTVPSINSRACLGLAIAEALASGKPVVVSNVGGGPEIVTDEAVGVLVPPGDAAALAAGVCRLLADRRQRERGSARGRELVLERFDKDQTNRTIESRFRDLLR